MERRGGDAETSPESPMMGGDRANTEDKTNHSASTETTNKARDNCVEQALNETLSNPVNNPVEPPVDWLEPLEEDYDEDDDDHSLDLDDNREAEIGSLARESERSHRGRGSGTVGRRRRRRQFTSDEGWEDWPVLGEGWKRKVVLRRSGLSVGQSDTYYMSPKGDRLRSKIELLRCIGNTVDLRNFDFKMGKFVAGEVPRRGPKRRKLGHSSPADCGFSSESSFHNEAADTGDRTYSPGPPFSLTHSAQHLSSSHNKVRVSIPSPGTSQADPSLSHVSLSTGPNRHNSPSKERLPPTTVLGICIRCRNSFIGKEGQTTCTKCSKACSATKDNRNIVFRKWLPCGVCRACQITEDCGVCASCRNHKLNPDSRRPIRCCRRKCLCPSLKRRLEDVPSPVQFGSAVHKPPRRFSERSGAINTASKMSMPDFKDFPQHSDSDEQSPLDDDDNKSFLRKNRRRRSCGRCKGCVSKADCGVCNYCVNKPKFGGTNKKKQKCRRRQCQREAVGWTNRPRFTHSRKTMSHQSREHWDFEFSDNEGEQERRTKDSHVDRAERDSSHSNGQPHLSSDAAHSHRPNRTFSSPARVQTRLQADKDTGTVVKNGLQARRDTKKSLPANGEEHAARTAACAARFKPGPNHASDAREQPPRGGAEAPPLSPAPQQHPAEDDEGKEQDGPTITQIFSLGGSGGGSSGVDLEPGLMQLLSALRNAVLPVLWCAVLAEGPRLQLLQCSKLSSMADTSVQIEPGFYYHVTVQGQPLLPTHRIYYTHPTRLTSAVQVAALLDDLERYTVCRGVEQELPAGPEPVILDRVAMCEFLVPPEAKCCVMCKRAQQKE